MKLFIVMPLCVVILCSSASDDAAIRKIFRQTLGAPCPNGWTPFKSYCYLVRSYIKTWHQAQAFCHARKGELVKMSNAEENEFVLSLVRRKAPSLKQVWIGLSWDSGAKRFSWSDNSLPIYTNWAQGEPNGRAREPCGHMYTGHRGRLPYRASGNWNDIRCQINPSWPNGLVCKRLP